MDNPAASLSRIGQDLFLYAEMFELLNEGVLLLDNNLRPMLANAAAKEMLGLQPTSLPPRLPSEDLLSIAGAAKGGEPVEQVVTLWFPQSRTLRVAATDLTDGHVLVTLTDVSEEVRAQRIRREFVAHASHELKTPVASLQALASAIMQALEDDIASAAQFSEKIVAEADRLGRLISDLLDLSRLEDVGRAPDDPVDLSAIAIGEIEDVNEAAATRGLILQPRIAPHVWLQGDAQQLGLMIRNLLDNAIRYTPDGGRVTLDLADDESTVTLSVTDTGIGIPRDAQQRVFERFYRVDKARTRDKGGTGLGLAIVKHVAELHGGSVDVDSELGRGSTLTVHLPRSPHVKEL